MAKYLDYMNDVRDSAHGCLKDMGCQPILFIGSGLSARYFNTPSWDLLLSQICFDNPILDKDYIYYKQAYGTLPEVGEAFIGPFHEWAWSTPGKSNFGQDLFQQGVPKDTYLKKYVAEKIRRQQPKDIGKIKDQVAQDEIVKLQAIRPNSIITTNYDSLCEMIFPEYASVVGQRIIKAHQALIGEIYKIHGCINDVPEIVLTATDYKGWNDRKKYLSAKLLTYFLEHPVIILGYSAQDANVVSILRDIDEILSPSGQMVPNIYYVVHDKNIGPESNPPREILLDLGGGRSMRVNAIYAKDFGWVYDAFAASEGIENVNPRLLRALMSRTYELVRHDIPKMTMQVNYATLEQAVNSDQELPRLLGITSVSDPEMFNAAYPYILSAVGNKLGFTGWHQANQLLTQILERDGVDIKSSDNQYHIAVKSGTNSVIHKYSDTCVELLRKVYKEEAYDATLKRKRMTSANKAAQGTR